MVVAYRAKMAKAHAAEKAKRLVAMRRWETERGRRSAAASAGEDVDVDELSMDPLLTMNAMEGNEEDWFKWQDSGLPEDAPIRYDDIPQI